MSSALLAPHTASLSLSSLNFPMQCGAEKKPLESSALKIKSQLVLAILSRSHHLSKPSFPPFKLE